MGREYRRNHIPNFAKLSCMLPVAVARSSSDLCYMLCTSGFVDEVKVSHDGTTAHHVFAYNSTMFPLDLRSL